MVRPEDERIDAVRYALQEAIKSQIAECGSTYPLDSLPCETVAEAFLKKLEQHDYLVVEDESA